MSDCLCCHRNVPSEAQKQCPECGQHFKGIGWNGMDAHWKANHENVMPYQTFRAGLCKVHLESGREKDHPHPARKIHPGKLGSDFQKAAAERSSHVENVLTHSLVAKIAQELWRRDPFIDLKIFNTEVDDSGFDLVLGCQGVMRFIQIKQTHTQGNAVKYSLRLDFSRMAGACAVVLVYAGDTLEIDHCLFFGGAPNKPMPDIEANRASQSPGRRTAEGVRKIRENYRDVPRHSFQGPLSISALVDVLFHSHE